METGKKAQRPNFFILLDINPGEEWNPIKFVQVLKTKRAEWSRQSSTSIGQRASLAKRNLELIAQIEAVMGNEELRSQEKKEAFELLASKQTARLELFEGRLAFLNAKEEASPEEIANFIKEFQDIYSAQAIKRRITVPIRTEKQVTRSALEPSQAKAIAELLQALNMSSLYELLNCPELTSTQILLDKAERLYRDVSMITTKTQEVTDKGKLAGLAKVIFTSEEKRKQYDESLHQARFATLFKVLEEQVNQSADKEISLKQTELFLDDAHRAGWDRQEALVQLKEQARTRRWLVHTSPQKATPQKVRCGNCHELNEVNQKFCSQCRQPLFIQCPDCEQHIQAASNVCGQCGFPVGNRYLVENQLQDLQIVVQTGELQKAQQLLDEIQALWNPKKQDIYRQKMARYQSEIRHLREKLRKVEVHFQQLIEQKKYFEAEKYLSSTETATLSNRVQRRNEVQREITKVRALLQPAMGTNMSANEKIALCRQALLLCTDYQEARNLLKATPPAAPGGLKAQLRGSIVSLSWEPSLTQGVMYIVVRNSLTQPHSPHDGTVLATVAGLHYEDSQPEIGVPLYYAIFAECEHVASSKSALLDQPLLLLEDVTQVNVEVNDHQVRLSWIPPKHAVSVVIVRKNRLPPGSASDGVVLGECAPEQRTLIDRDVQNHQTYYYALFARFKKHNGLLITAQGVRIKATPDAPPTPIRSLDMQLRQGTATTEREVTLSWTTPAKGQVIILKSSQSLRQYENKVLPENMLYTLGQRLEDQPDRVVDRQVRVGVSYYVPVIIFNKMAYMGTEHRLATVDDVQNVRWQNLGPALRFQWEWPAQSQEAIISYNQLRCPRLDDELSAHIKVSRAEYERLGYYDVRGNKDTEYHVMVTAIIIQGNEEIAAQGVKVLAHQAEVMTVTYEIKKPTLLRRHPLLYITTDRAGQLPSLVLIGTRDRLPIHKTDGIPICRIEPTSIGGKGYSVALSTEDVPWGTCCKLFLEDDRFYQVVDICHPHEDKLRIN